MTKKQFQFSLRCILQNSELDQQEKLVLSLVDEYARARKNRKGKAK